MKKSLAVLAFLGTLSLVSAAAFSVRAEEATANPNAKKEASKDSGGEEGGSPKKDKGTQDISGGRFAGDPVYLHLAPMVLPVISDQGVEQLITIQIDLQLEDVKTADKVRTNMPRVRDALMTALYGGLGQGSLRNGKLVDVVKVKNKATAAVESVLGSGVKNVLVQGVSQRML